MALNPVGGAAGVLFSVTVNSLASTSWNSTSSAPVAWLQSANIQRKGRYTDSYRFGEDNILLHISSA